MKTEFLKELLKDVEGNEDMIKKIMAENGKDIEAAKGELAKVEADRDKYKEQLDKATESLEKFKDVNPDELTAEIDKLKKDLEDKDAEHAAMIADMEFDSAIEKAITESGAKNAKAVKALLDIESLKGSKNQKDDIKAALEEVKKDNDYMFGSSEPINNSVGSTRGGGGTDTKTAALRAAAGLPPEDEK